MRHVFDDDRRAALRAAARVSRTPSAVSARGQDDGDRVQAPTVTVLGDDSATPHLAAVRERAVVRSAADESQLRAALPGSDILLVTDFRTAALERAWRAADRLQWVHAASAGVDKLMFSGLIESGLPVTNAKGIFDRSIAEYVLGVILMFAKDSRSNIVYQQQRRWVHRDTETIEHKRVLVAGAGSIGHAIGALCRAAGMRVTGVAQHERAGDDVFEAVHAASDIQTHLSGADYVVVAAPLTDATRGWFDARLFAAMPAHARLINIGRGPIVVTADLVAALDAGEIAGAALDVFEQEPLPADHRLWAMDEVLLSAHMAGDFIGWRGALIDQFVANLSRWKAGEALFNRVDTTRGYAASAG